MGEVPLDRETTHGHQSKFQNAASRFSVLLNHCAVPSQETKRLVLSLRKKKTEL